jgi:drug/metabolite transporter (DMT)-like permease
MHLFVVPLILVGLVMVVRGTAQSRWWSIAIGIAGTAGCAIHLVFLASGDERFTTMFSVSLIAAFGLSSAALTVIALRTRPLAMEEKGYTRVFS